MPIAVITGALSPIGQAIALALRERGYDLILHARREIPPPPFSKGEEFVRADLSTTKGQEEFCSVIKSRTNQIDVLVHNAADYAENTFRNLDRETWRSTMSLNVEAPLFLTQALLPLLSASAGSSVIHVTDCMSERVRKNHFAYTASKALLTQLTLALSVELAPKIRVNAVAPGVVLSSRDASGNKKNHILEKIPLGRLATVDDVAKAVAFLAFDAPYVTGEIFNVDGGRRLV